MTIPGYDLYRDRVPGINRTVGAGGDIPHQSIRGYTSIFDKRFYYSRREIALLLEKTCRAGYGVLPIGTVMANDFNDADKLVPYTPDTIALTDVSRVFLLTDLTTSNTFYVEMNESYKLAAADVIVLTDTDGTYETETISTIDRTTYAEKALVTLTGSTSGTFTIAKNANCYVKAKTEADTNKCCLATFVLEMNVDTGAGATAQGGLGTVLVSNAIVYADSCVGMDATALSDLANVTSDGIYYIFK